MKRAVMIAVVALVLGSGWMASATSQNDTPHFVAANSYFRVPGGVTHHRFEIEVINSLRTNLFFEVLGHHPDLGISHSVHERPEGRIVTVHFSKPVPSGGIFLTFMQVETTP